MMVRNDSDFRVADVAKTANEKHRPQIAAGVVRLW